MAIENQRENRVESTEEKVGEGVGGVSGALAGAGLGSAAGPIGTIIGGIAGAAGGWWAGEKVGRAAEGWEEHDAYYRDRWKADDRKDRLGSYDDARIGYGVGHLAGRNPDYRDRRFEDVETDIRGNWRYDGHSYDAMRPYIREGYDRSSRAD